MGLELKMKAGDSMCWHQAVCCYQECDSQVTWAQARQFSNFTVHDLESEAICNGMKLSVLSLSVYSMQGWQFA